MVAGKSFNRKFTAKIDFIIIPLVCFITIADAVIKSLKYLHTLCDKYLDHMLGKFEQNRMVRTTQNFELFWHKMVNHFWQSVDAILEVVSVTKTIVWC